MKVIIECSEQELATAKEVLNYIVENVERTEVEIKRAELDQDASDPRQMEFSFEHSHSPFSCLYG